jgi:hypothetical protein
MNLLELMQGQLTPEVINQLSQQTGAAPEQTEVAAQGVLSTLLGGLSKNAQSPEGAGGIMAALDRDHDGSVLNDIMGLLGGGGAPQAPASALNGAGILGHILGGQQQNAAGMISQASGVAPEGVMGMMAQLAPLVMGVLGQQKQQQGFDASGLASLLGGSVQSQSSNPLMQMATKFLDKDGDGSMMDDVMGMVGSKLLGGLFGK